MACPSARYSGHDQSNTGWQNWAQSVAGPVARLFEPDSLPDLVNVVQAASSQGRELRVFASRWASEPITYSPDWMVGIRRLNRTLNNVIPAALTEAWRAHQQNRGDDVLYHVEAGIRIADLNERLAAAGLSLPTMGGANGQLLAGVVSTGVHGGDIDFPPFPDLVKAIHLVTTAGREVWLERETDPITSDELLARCIECPDAEIIRDDVLFDSALVGLGRFGIVYSYVIRVRGVFRLAEWTVRLPTATVTALLREGVSKGTFLQPLLTHLGHLDVDLRNPNPLPAELEVIAPAHPRGLEIAWDTQNLDRCWVKRRWHTSNAQDIGMELATNAICLRGARGLVDDLEAQVNHVIGVGVAVTAAIIPLAAIATAIVAHSKIHWLREQLRDQPDMLAGDMVALIARVAWDLGPLGGHAVRQRTNQVFEDLYKTTVSTGKRGIAHVIISGTRWDSDEICARGPYIEPIFDAWRPDYLDYLDAILQLGAQLKQVGWLSLRWSAPSRAHLSMHGVDSPNAVAVEVTSLRGLPDNDHWMREMELLALQHRGRPHWGQNNKLSSILLAESRAEAVKNADRLLQDGKLSNVEYARLFNAPSDIAIYAEKLTKWRTALAQLVGTDKTFDFDFARERGLEPSQAAVPPLKSRRVGDVLHELNEKRKRRSASAVAAANTLLLGP